MGIITINEQGIKRDSSLPQKKTDTIAVTRSPIQVNHSTKPQLKPAIRIQQFSPETEEPEKLQSVETRPEKKVQITASGDYVYKEAFDKFGSGLMSQQYLNILLSQVGASYLFIGLFNGLKDLFSIFTSIFFNEYLRVRNPEKYLINILGVIISLSYLCAAIGLFYESIYFTGLMILIAGILLTVLGSIYAKCFTLGLRNKPELKNLPHYSIAVIAFALITASYILELYPITGPFLRIGILAFPGYFVLISIAAICFIISSIFLSRLIKEEKFEIKTTLYFVIKEHLEIIYRTAPALFKNKIVLVALIAGTMTGLVQTVGNIYYGIYIYKMFKYIGFGGFVNVAMIFIISILSALMATTISRLLSKKYGNVPLLTFGTTLVAIQPLAYFFNPNLISISMATIAGVIGSSLTGLAIGLLISHALEKENREHYYMIFSFIVTLPYIIFIPLGSYLAQVLGLQILFLILGLILLMVVTPIYFILLLSMGKKIA
jgi:hypothetical protein